MNMTQQINARIAEAYLFDNQQGSRRNSMKGKCIALLLLACLLSYSIGFTHGQVSAYKKMKDSRTYIHAIMDTMKK
jgi:hypothetical protein